MDPLWLIIALALGIAAQRLLLPPLVGFLTAGFVLHAFGEQGGAILDGAARLGVLLLLFSIGLKLRPGSFLTPAIWAVAPTHLAASMLITAVLLTMAFASTGLTADWLTFLLLGFALSFSSTVLAVKIFEERGEMRSRHALVAIGILIIQDLAAVGFLLFAIDAPPTLWAFLLCLLPLLRPVLLHLLATVGHKEMLVLYGLTITVCGAALFDLVGMKDGLGALIFGLLLSNHPKSIELSRALLSFKDFFLIGFFLSIGLTGFPALTDLVYILLFIAVLLPIKAALFFILFTRFRLRARSAFLAVLGLLTFSEFGLIVAEEAVAMAWLDERWLVIIAIAVAVSFIITAILNSRAHELYKQIEHLLARFESQERLPEDAAPDIGDAEVLIVGMGRVGRSAYRAMSETFTGKVCGADIDARHVEALKKNNYNVIMGDAEDIDFWRSTVQPSLGLVMLALPTHKDALLATKWLRTVGYSGKIGAVAKHEDERIALLEAGVDSAFNYYAEVGVGFAEHVQLEVSG
jgi:predicted Kef-type K+ transport protein